MARLWLGVWVAVLWVESGIRGPRGGVRRRKDRTPNEQESREVICTTTVLSRGVRQVLYRCKTGTLALHLARPPATTKREGEGEMGWMAKSASKTIAKSQIAILNSLKPHGYWT